MSEKRLKLLWIHDSSAESRTRTRLFRDARDMTVQTVESGAVKIPKTDPPDLIILDSDAAADRILDALTRIRIQAPRLPILILTSSDDEILTLQALKTGAQDVLIRDGVTPANFRRHAHLALARHALDAAKNDILSVVSHELKAPLAVLHESVLQLTEGLYGDLTADQKQILYMGKDGLDRLKRLVDLILDSSRLEADPATLQRQAVPVAALIQKCAALFKAAAAKKGLKITQLLPDPELSVFADKDRLEQVFVNLIGNAIKFTTEGRVTVAVEEKGDAVECSVSDTGRGIAAKDVPLVFQKYRQFGPRLGAGERGLGLGLSIVKKIVDAHEGQITLQSEPGKGTTLTLLLPKYTVRHELSEYVSRNLKPETAGKEGKLSVIIFGVKGREENLAGVLRDMEALVRKNLRDKGDKVFHHSGATFAVLAGAAKQDALAVAERIRGIIGEKCDCSVVSFPEDTTSVQEFIKKTVL